MKLVVDTNVLIAGLLKDSATRKILLHPLFHLSVPECAFDEIERHKDELLEKSGLTKHGFHQILDGLKRRLENVPMQDFASFYPTALELMKNIDETDAPFIALALSFENDGVWTNDVHFERQQKVRIWSTDELMAELEAMEEDAHY